MGTSDDGGKRSTAKLDGDGGALRGRARGVCKVAQGRGVCESGACDGKTGRDGSHGVSLVEQPVDTGALKLLLPRPKSPARREMSGVVGGEGRANRESGTCNLSMPAPEPGERSLTHSERDRDRGECSGQHARGKSNNMQ